MTKDKVEVVGYLTKTGEPVTPLYVEVSKLGFDGLTPLITTKSVAGRLKKLIEFYKPYNTRLLAIDPFVLLDRLEDIAKLYEDAK